MLDTVLTVGVLQRTEGAWRPFALLYGQLPDGFDPQQLTDACADRPALRKFKERLAVVLPDGPDRWVMWLFDQVPPVTALQGLTERLIALTRGLRAAAPAGTPASDKPEVIGLLLERIAQTGRRRGAVITQLIADACVETGLARAAVCAPVRSGKPRALAASDTALLVHADEIRQFMRRHLDDSASVHRLGADDLSAEGLDGALLADSAGAERIALGLPPRGAGGLAIALFDPVPLPDAVFRDLDSLHALASGRRPAALRQGQALRLGLYAVVAALAVWLALPAPVVVSAPVTTMPMQAVALAIPVGGYAEVVQVRVGDTVREGDVIARFRAPELEEQRATLGVEMAIETVAAQAALSANDYGSFLLSQQKLEAAAQRLNRVEERLESLIVRAPEAGRVVFAITPDVVGRYLPLGETVAIVQPRAEFAVQLSVSRSDAPLLTTGQTGEVWFRGLPGASWRIETETPVTLIPGMGRDQDQLVVRARITDDRQERLLGGLAGFARIEVGQDMRVKAMGRYMIEYVRSKAWIWFGLTF